MDDVNPFKHRGHSNAFSPVWIRLCLVKAPAWVNPFSHRSHLNGFSHVWISLCVVKWLEFVNTFSHRSQLNGFVTLLMYSFFDVIPFFKSILTVKQIKVNMGKMLSNFNQKMIYYKKHIFIDLKTSNWYLAMWHWLVMINKFHTDIPTIFISHFPPKKIKFPSQDNSLLTNLLF